MQRLPDMEQNGNTLETRKNPIAAWVKVLTLTENVDKIELPSALSEKFAEISQSLQAPTFVFAGLNLVCSDRRQALVFQVLAMFRVQGLG